MPTPRAAGSRSRAEATSARISPSDALQRAEAEHDSKGTERARPTRARRTAATCSARRRRGRSPRLRLPASSGARRNLQRGRRSPRPPRSRPEGPPAVPPLAPWPAPPRRRPAITSSITDAVEHLGHEAGADALDLVRAGQPAGEHRRRRGLHGDHLHRGATLLEHLPHAGDRATGADPADDASTSPSRSRQISSAVVRRWTSGFAGLLNCCGMKRAALGHDPLGQLPPPRSSRRATGSRAPRRRRCEAGRSAPVSCPRAA